MKFEFLDLSLLLAFRYELIPPFKLNALNPLVFKRPVIILERIPEAQYTIISWLIYISNSFNLFLTLSNQKNLQRNYF